MKVLYVVTRFPVERPTQGDAVRARNLLAELAPDYDITCVAVVRRHPGVAEVAGLEALGVRVEVIPISAPGALGRGLRLWDHRPGQVRLFADPKAIDRVAALAAGADLVHCQLVRAGDLLPAGPAATVDFIDALSFNFEGRATRRGLKGWADRHDAARLAPYEQQLLARADAGFVVTQADRKAIGDPAHVEVVPMGVRPMETGHVARVPGRIIFSGNLRYAPNVDAAEWLATEIFPTVRADGAHLRIVGARPARRVRRLSRRRDVAVVADVEDMATELATASVAVAPMRLGSGMQIKLLEAIMAGTPVVTTSQAANAIGIGPPLGVSVGDDAGALAASIDALLAEPDRAAAMAGRAREAVSAEFTWPRAAELIAAAWERVAGR